MDLDFRLGTLIFEKETLGIIRFRKETRYLGSELDTGYFGLKTRYLGSETG